MARFPVKRVSMNLVGLVLILFGSCIASTTLLAQSEPAQLADTKIGIKLFQAGNIAEAMQHLRQAVKQDDRDADAWHFLALSYLKLDQNKDARKALEHAVAL